MLLSFAAVLAAQLSAAPEPALDPLPSFDPHTRLHFMEDGADTWVRGRSYKARFSPAGFRYVPFLGSDAPRNFPVDFRLRSAHVGGVPVELAPEAKVGRDGERVILDRGPVDVIYDLELTSIEQSFLLDVRGLEGDLVLELDVETDLAATARGAAHRFLSTHGGVDYSAAFALDGRGETLAIDSSLDQSTLRLTVPAWFVANVDGPLLVDPIVSTYVIDDIPADLSHVDVAFEVDSYENTYVYEEQFSGRDTDIYSRSVDTFTNQLVSGNYFDITADSVTGPKVAQVQLPGAGPMTPTPDRFLVVGLRTFIGGGNAVVGRILSAADGTYGPEFTIATGTGSDPLSAIDVGGSSDRDDPNPLFMVTFTRTVLGANGYEMSEARVVTPTGALGQGHQFIPVAGGVFDQLVVSKGTSGNQGVDHWNFAARTRFSPSFPWQIVVGQFDPDGNIIAGPTSIRDYSGIERPEDLDVYESLIDGASSPTFLVSARVENASQRNRKELMACTGTIRISTHSLTEMEHGSFDREVGPVRLGTTWSHPVRPMFIAVYQEEEAFNQHGIYYTALNQPAPGQLAIVERRVRVGDGAEPNRGGPAVATRASSGFHSRFALIAWSERIDAATPLRISGGTTELSSAGAVGQQYCYGAPNSTGERGFLGMTGSPFPTGDKTLVASGLPAGEFGFFVVGQGSQALPGAGGSAGTLCLGGAGIGRALDSILLTDAAGRASRTIDPTNLPTPSAHVAAMAGERWNFQFWHRDDMGSGPTSNYTNAVALRFR